MGNYRREEYHTDFPLWRDLDRPRGQLAGIELEITNPSGFRKILRDLPDPPKAGYRPLTETDGSLSSSTGVEIVFPPYKYSTIKNNGSFFARSLRALERGGARPNNDTGMHVNINTVDWSVDKKKLMVAAVNGFTPRQLKAIGGRLPNDYCCLVSQLDDWWNERENTSSINVIYEIAYECNHTVADAKGNRIELRFPRATVKLTEVTLVLEFAQYLEEYIDNLFSVMSNIDFNESLETNIGQPVHQGFLTYLRSRRSNAAIKRLIKKISDA